MVNMGSPKLIVISTAGNQSQLSLPRNQMDQPSLGCPKLNRVTLNCYCSKVHRWMQPIFPKFRKVRLFFFRMLPGNMAKQHHRDPYSGRNSPEAKWCQVLLHCWREMWLLVRWAGRYRIVLVPFSLKMSQQAKIHQPLKVARAPLGSLTTLSFLESQNWSTIITFMVYWQ